MRWVKKTRVKLFRLSFSTGRSSRKSQVFFFWIPQSENSIEKSCAEKALFRLCKKARFGFQSKKAVFD